jgi:carboxylate-amine ligase
MLVEENRWRAQRYGTDEGLVDFGKGAVVPYAVLLDEIIQLVAEDAAHFGCGAEVAASRDILARGTSADRQRKIFIDARAAGVGRRAALDRVVDHLVAETVEGL